jgi:hypothetical protein
MANSLKEAIEARDFQKLQVLTKKPIFSFLETEIVRCLKKIAMNPPVFMIEGGNNKPGQQVNQEEAKKNALDNLML